MVTENITGQKRKYMIDLLRSHSISALVCSALSLGLAFYAVTAGVIKTIIVRKWDGFESFIYFTMISNTLAALAMAFVFPFAVEGIRKKRFTVPAWTAVMHYMATTSICIVMAFVMFFMVWVDFGEAYGGANIITHLICPALMLIAFFEVENGYIYTFRDRLLACLPFYIYLIVYFIEVVAIGEEKGGWPDIYRITDFVSPLIAIPILLVFAFAVSSIIAVISNHLTKKRQERMYSGWTDDMIPVEVRIEAYGLGRMTGLRGEKNNISIPYDIFEYLAEKYHIPVIDLLNPFMKGVREGIKERSLKSGHSVSDKD